MKSIGALTKRLEKVEEATQGLRDLRARFEAAVGGIIKETGCTFEQAAQALLRVNPENERFLTAGAIEATAEAVDE